MTESSGVEPTFDSIAPVVRVSDLGAALRRYTQLGFDTRRYDGPDRYGYADRGGISIHLAETPEAPEEFAAELYLYVSDADAVFREWSASGVTGRFVEPYDTAYGLREFAFVDEDGTAHRIGSWLRRSSNP